MFIPGTLCAPLPLIERTMVRLRFSIQLNYDITEPGCDFIFSVHAAQTRYQTVVNESLQISQPQLQPNLYTDPVTHTRYLRLKQA